MTTQTPSSNRREKDKEELEIQDQHVISGHTKVPNYRRYMSSSGNKAMLSAFVCNYITSSAPCRLTAKQTIILAGGFEDEEETKTIRKDSVESLPDLMSDQEEANTRIVPSTWPRHTHESSSSVMTLMSLCCSCIMQVKACLDQLQS